MKKVDEDEIAEIHPIPIRKKNSLNGTGFCLHCGRELSNSKKFCNNAHNEAYHLFEELKKKGSKHHG
jgi:hypothetical protein